VKAFLARVKRLVRARRRVIAALLAGLAVWAGLTAVRPSGPATVSVLVSQRPLLGGHPVAADDVGVRELPADALPAEYLHEPGQAVGRPLTVSLPSNAVLVPTSVVTRDSLAAPGLVVLPVTLASTGAGLIEVGDRIDLLAADSEGEAGQVATGARVVAVLNSTDESSPLSPVQSSGPVVLVELRPDALARVAAAAARGPLGFGLR